MKVLNQVDIFQQFTAAQKTRVEFMRRIAQTITETTKEAFVLKGGTALLLAYGLPRYSTDLDYDGKDQSIDLVKHLQTGADKAGVQIESLKLRKDTETVKRYMLHYKGSENSPLKIEISYRQSDVIEEKDVVVTDGIRVYTIEKLAMLKAEAFLNRMKARDVFDVAFILKHHPSTIQGDLLLRVAARVEDLSLELLSASIREERILRGFDPDIVVLEMQGAIESSLPKPSVLQQLHGNSHRGVKKNKNIEPEF